jgi:hypothetical protein
MNPCDLYMFTYPLCIDCYPLSMNMEFTIVELKEQKNFKGHHVLSFQNKTHLQALGFLESPVSWKILL